MGELTDRQVLLVAVEDIVPNPAQPRQEFSGEDLEELAQSIRCHGILQPLTVRPADQGWELVAGERRLRAAKLAGLDTVPCLVAQVDDGESALLALVENIQRKNLHYLEEAAAISAYLRRSGATQEATARQLGYSPSALANKLRLLRLSPACREALTRNGLSERHARCLLQLEDDRERQSAITYIAGHHLTVAQAEQYIQKRLQALQSTPPQRRRTININDLRLFLKTGERGLNLMREAGGGAGCGREETEDAILLTIRIPKSPGKAL